MKRPAIFDPVTLKWEGAEYIIPSNRIMQAIARIEEIITIPELKKFEDRGAQPMVKLSMAYGSVLRFAGARVEDDEIYAALFRDEDDTAATVSVAIMTLMLMMLPKFKRDEVSLKKTEPLTAVHSTISPVAATPEEPPPIPLTAEEASSAKRMASRLRKDG